MSMQVSIEDVQGLEKRMKVLVSLDVVNKVVNECFQKVAKTARIDGFRPGKIPPRVLEERFGDSVRYHDAAPKLVNDTLWEAFKQVEVEPAGRPSIEEIVLLKDQPLNYSVLFEIFPEFTVNDLTGVTVEKTISELTDADVEKAIERIRLDHATWSEITTSAQNDDVVTLSYTVEVNGEAVPQEEAKNVSVQLNDANNPSIIPELRKQLLGLSVNDEKTLHAVFPNDYPAASVAGKEGAFSVKVHTVKRSELPELNEAFFEKFDEAKNLDELKKTIRKNMAYYLENSLLHINKTVIFKAWAGVNPIALPKALVQADLENMTRGFLSNLLKQEKVSDQEIQRYMPMIAPMYQKASENRVRISLILEAFLKANPQEITDEKVREAAEQRSALYQDPKTWLDEYWADVNNQENLRSALVEKAIVDFLSKTATLTEISLDYFAVIEKEKLIGREDIFVPNEDDGGDAGEGDEGHGGHHVHDENCQHDHHHHHDHEGA